MNWKQAVHRSIWLFLLLVGCSSTGPSPVDTPPRPVVPVCEWTMPLGTSYPAPSAIDPSGRFLAVTTSQNPNLVVLDLHHDAKSVIALSSGEHFSLSSVCSTSTDSRPSFVAALGGVLLRVSMREEAWQLDARVAQPDGVICFVAAAGDGRIAASCESSASGWPEHGASRRIEFRDAVTLDVVATQEDTGFVHDLSSGAGWFATTTHSDRAMKTQLWHRMNITREYDGECLAASGDRLLLRRSLDDGSSRQEVLEVVRTTDDTVITRLDLPTDSSVTLGTFSDDGKRIALVVGLKNIAIFDAVTGAKIGGIDAYGHCAAAHVIEMLPWRNGLLILGVRSDPPDHQSKLSYWRFDS